jgi:hypothetical protein
MYICVWVCTAIIRPLDVIFNMNCDIEWDSRYVRCMYVRIYVCMYWRKPHPLWTSFEPYVHVHIHTYILIVCACTPFDASNLCMMCFWYHTYTAQSHIHISTICGDSTITHTHKHNMCRYFIWCIWYINTYIYVYRNIIIITYTKIHTLQYVGVLVEFYLVYLVFARGASGITHTHIHLHTYIYRFIQCVVIFCLVCLVCARGASSITHTHTYIHAVCVDILFGVCGPCMRCF